MDGLRGSSSCFLEVGARLVTLHRVFYQCDDPHQGRVRCGRLLWSKCSWSTTVRHRMPRLEWWWWWSSSLHLFKAAYGIKSCIGGKMDYKWGPLSSHDKASWRCMVLIGDLTWNICEQSFYFLATLKSQAAAVDISRCVCVPCWRLRS